MRNTRPATNERQRGSRSAVEAVQLKVGHVESVLRYVHGGSYSWLMHRLAARSALMKHAIWPFIPAFRVSQISREPLQPTPRPRDGARA